jgi:hypothetical protein
MSKKQINDDELFELFQTGTAPAREQLFAKRVNAELRQRETVSHFLRMAKYTCAVLLLIGLFFLVQLYLPFVNTFVQTLSESLNSLAVQVIAGVVCLIVAVVRRPTYY